MNAGFNKDLPAGRPAGIFLWPETEGSLRRKTGKAVFAIQAAMKQEQVLGSPPHEGLKNRPFYRAEKIKESFLHPNHTGKELKSKEPEKYFLIFQKYKIQL